MESLSGRPLTAPPSDQPGDVSSIVASPPADPGYQPSLFDLTFATSHYFPNHLPSTFLEAASVDSAPQLGRGASFTASVRTLPEGPKEISSTQVLPTFTVTSISPAPPRPKHIVLKVAKVRFDRVGDPFPEYKSALQSVLTEYHALLYPPLFKHRNIIDILGLAWGTNPFEPDHRLPALVLEYAEYGTLRDVIKRGDLSSAEKRLLCHDIASGLHALHDAGLVHGDVKAENVLICSHGDARKRVAKLGDFGFSIVEEGESQMVWLGGTKPWQAPEVRHAIPVGQAKQTDVYSLGLLIWSLAINGLNPLRRFLVSDQPEAQWDEEMQDFKEQDGLRRASQTQLWMPIHLSKLFVENPSEPSVASIAQKLQTLQPSLRTALISQACGMFVQNDDLLKVLDQVFANSLVKDPAQRNLGAIIGALQPTVDPRFDEKGDDSAKQRVVRKITNTTDEERHYRNTPIEIPKARGEQQPLQLPGPSLPKDEESGSSMTLNNAKSFPVNIPTLPNRPEKPSWARRGFKHLWLSWQAVRDLSPSLQHVIFEASSALEEVSNQGGARLLLLSALLINGYGCVPDPQRALKVLRRSAELGNWTAQAYLYRLHASYSTTEVPDTDIKRYLEIWALRGSQAAWGGYASTHPPEQIATLYQLYLDAYGGVGSDWYNTSNMLHGLQQRDWIKDDFLLAQAAKLDNIKEYRINQRGDTLLHFAAACGRWRPLKALIEQYGFDVNCRNNAGDTPIICAMRAGHGGNIILLLTIYNADPTLASHNGETALHWLLNMGISSIPNVAKDLISRGAAVDAMTNEIVCHSQFPGTVDADFQLPGTPLSWAVHNNKTHAVKTLLEHGANPYFDNDVNTMGPLSWAAYYHHHECFRMMIDELERRGQENADPRHAVFYSPLLRAAVHSADRWSMILRNGIKWRENLRATLDILREKTTLVTPAWNFGGPNQSLFYYAVSEAHDEVVEYMLEHQWHSKHINEACGHMSRTPVLEAVRWWRLPLVKMLVEHGADVHAKACNPFQMEKRDWTALHILAHEGHNENTDEILDSLLNYGLDVEGRVAETPHQGPSQLSKENGPGDLSEYLSQLLNISEATVETPLSCALRSNAFNLCNSLRKKGASVTSSSFSAGLYKVWSPTTILGHLIISNARYSLPRLRYLLNTSAEISLDAYKESLFIVEPNRALSALHRAALANRGVSTTFDTPITRAEFDLETNAEIMGELLAYFNEPKYLDAHCRPDGKTALMLAVEEMNTEAIRLLLRAGADRSLEDDAGRSALEYVVEKVEEAPEHAAKWEEILRLFELY